MRRTLTVLLAQALIEAARTAHGPSSDKPEEAHMNGTDEQNAPQTDQGQPVQGQPVQGQAVQNAPPSDQPAPTPPPASPNATPTPANEQVSWLTDYLPVVLATASGLMKPAGALEDKTHQDGHVDSASLDMIGNYLAILGVLAEGFRRRQRRAGEPGAQSGSGDSGGQNAPAPHGTDAP